MVRPGSQPRRRRLNFLVNLHGFLPLKRYRVTTVSRRCRRRRFRPISRLRAAPAGFTELIPWGLGPAASRAGLGAGTSHGVNANTKITITSRCTLGLEARDLRSVAGVVGQGQDHFLEVLTPPGFHDSAAICCMVLGLAFVDQRIHADAEAAPSGNMSEHSSLANCAGAILTPRSPRVTLMQTILCSFIWPGSLPAVVSNSSAAATRARAPRRRADRPVIIQPAIDGCDGLAFVKDVEEVLAEDRDVATVASSDWACSLHRWRGSAKRAVSSVRS